MRCGRPGQGIDKPDAEYEAMLVNIVHFPKIKDGKDRDFLQWFADSNRAYADHPGFIRRILLRPREGGSYVAIVEHESHETFMAMHTSSTQAALRQAVQPLFEGNPDPKFYDVVVE
jgi:antibiotic biosynthesis monooxygenase (ABM) superfamily enzyme